MVPIILARPEMHTQFPDGSRMTMDADGYRIQTNDGATISSSPDNRINSIDYAGSKVHREFEYDSNGISSVSYQNDLNGFRDTWKKQGESNWVQYDETLRASYRANLARANSTRSGKRRIHLSKRRLQ